MSVVTLRGRAHAGRRLALLHIAVIAAGNYLVQFPFTFLGIKNTWGAFVFPLVFLATDLTVRIFGRARARLVVLRAMFPALLLSYLISIFFREGEWNPQPQWWDVFVFRIATASFVAYVAGQLADIAVFDRLRRRKAWYVAPAASGVFSSAVDTAVFFFVAFHGGSDAFMAANWVPIALADYAVKLAVAALFFLPAYGALLHLLMRRSVEDAGDDCPSVPHP